MIKSTFVFLYICMLFYVSTYNGDKVIENRDTLDWDYFMLVTEWPQSSCEYTNASSHHHKCIIPPSVKGWVLHGLWPSTHESRQQPFYCKPWKFDVDKVKDLLPKMEMYWPNLFADTSFTSFWRHEYEKHGTCAASAAGFDTEHDYFNQAILLRDKYDMMNVLSSSDIIPGDNPYQIADIESAIHKGFNVEVCLECSYTKSIGQLLSGAYVCLNKQLQLIDCTDCEHKCNADEDTYYHPIHY